jgi:N-methylhydantoinase A
MTRPQHRIGIDVGGTFTDVVLLGETAEPIASSKVMNADTSRIPAVLRGIEDVLSVGQVDASEISYIAHGTTLTTNAVIERAGAITALVTNEGFRDVLEIGRFSRPAELIYDIHGRKAQALVPRRLRKTLRCRMDRNGKTVTSPDDGEIEALVRELREENVEAVAICFLFSFLDPSHEDYVAQELRSRMPDVEVLTSSSVMPEFREFPRTSTTVFAAYCAPILRAYFRELCPALESIGITCPVYVYQSNGGIASADMVMANPATTLLSGPAGAITGVANLPTDIKRPNVVTMDIGGTSLDVSIVRGGRPEFSTERELMGYPVGVPSLDIRAIGAGGGSVISVDEVGRVRVGPRSMGADPGPAAYGRGGSRPTLTDVNLLLGYLEPDYFAGGSVRLHPNLSEEAVGRVAKALGKSLTETAVGIFEVATNQIADAIREVGGGPVHACAVADRLGIHEVIVPRNPGVFAAAGMAGADFVHDSVRSILVDVTPSGLAVAEATLDELEIAAQKLLESEGVPLHRQAHTAYLEMRYKGQSTELALRVSGEIDVSDVDAVIDAFHSLHELTYGYSAYREVVEIVNVRLRSIGCAFVANTTSGHKPQSVRHAKATGIRRCYFPGASDRVETPVYIRDQIVEGAQVRGPALIDEASSTTVIPMGWTLRVSASGGLTLHKGDSR